MYSHYLESGCYLLFSDFVFKDMSRNACSNGNGYMKWRDGENSSKSSNLPG